MLLIAAAPVGFLSIPHWINAALFFLAILLPIHKTLLAPPAGDLNSEVKQSSLVLLVFLAPILAVFLGQVFRSSWNWSDFDAPARLLLGLMVYTTLTKVIRPSASYIAGSLAFGLVLALAALPLAVTTQALQRWGGRFATTLSDTNTFGSYVGLMVTMVICLMLFFPAQVDRSQRTPQKVLRWCALFSIGVGIWALIGSQSRGAWIAAAGALCAAIWILVRRSSARALGAGALVAILCIALAVFVGNSHGVFGRLESIFQELWAALHGHYRPNSAGVRIQMYRAAIDLIGASPFSGYGDLGYKVALKSPALAAQYPSEVLSMLGGAGPHSEIFGRALQSGIWGAVSVVLHLGVPSLVFWQNRRADSTPLGQAINNTGLILMIYLVLVQFTIEFTLKHTASFNAFILALLLAISVKSAHDADQTSKKVI